MPVGRVEDFEDGIVFGFDLDGHDVAVVSWRGRFFAFSNRCTHWNVPLTEAYVTGRGGIVCPYHDSTFEISTGRAIDGPAPDDLATYRVRVEDGVVLVDLA